ncbi:hypothetical protein H5397_15920 [Propioniciclava sp. MC1683]|uniref:P-type ATPase n=1 Tax=Propioniciclava sp. MC1683 TaxID=2760309 RepID=UPI00160474BF|nr:hypothetical protein [Propioniciclava sp. MC1683]MBB1502890.1 hypothetical protein [Propioniciclava sp. MC1683]
MAESATGLTEAQAQARLEAGQENTTNLKPLRTLQQARRESIFTVFNLNMVGLAVILLLLSEWIGAGVTLLLLGFSTTIRNVHESLAAKRLDAVRQAGRTRSTVIRDGRPRAIDSDRIVPGDLIVIYPGDQFQVDGIVTGAGAMLVDTAQVTGQRGWERVQAGDEVLAGSVCLSGRGRYIAQRVGADRLIQAQLSQRTALASRPTPLERLVARILSGLLVIVSVYALILLAKYFRLDVGEPGDAFVDAAPVIFSLLPTGLYLMIVVAYATGTADLARLGAVVHSARSVELLAESTVICFTEVDLLSGTDLRVEPLPPAEPERHDGAADDPDAWPSIAELRRTLGDIALSATERGPLVDLYARSCEGEERAILVQASHLATLGWFAVAFDDPDDPFLYVLAEPTLLGRSGASDEALVLARGPIDTTLVDAHGHPRLPEGLVPLCVIEPRRHLHPDAMGVVRAFQASGVHLKVFARDAPVEVLAALRAAGLSEEDERALLPNGGLSGAELEALPRDQWATAVREYRLFGGLTPAQMGDVVGELRDGGERVTVVGDGLTDLPAMQQAQLSVAPPASAQAALGVADIVLTDSSPGLLLVVLHRGQSIVRGLLDVMKLNLSLVVCTALLIGMVRLFGVGFPYVAGQGSLISILAITVPSLLLPLWARPAPVSSRSYLSILAGFVVPAGVLLSVAAFGVYLALVSRTDDVRVAQFGVTYTLLYAGLTLSVLIQPRLRTALLAISLALLGSLAPVIPLARWQFRLDLLPEPTDYLIVLLAVAAWTVAVHLVRRAVRHSEVA